MYIIKRKSGKNIYYKKIIIGCLGVGRCVGTTSLAISLASYLTGVYGLKTALIECNEHSDFMKIRKIIGIPYSNEATHFDYRRISFFKRTDSKNISEIMAQDYDVVILDMEYGYKDWKIDFLRCDVKLAAVGLNMWKVGYLKTFLDDCKDIITTIKYVSLTCPKDTVKTLKKSYKINLSKISYEEDVFCIQPCNFKTYENLLK